MIVTDMAGHRCLMCGVGVYQETSMADDWDGVLHCAVCGSVTKRWINNSVDPITKPRYADLNEIEVECHGQKQQH